MLREKCRMRRRFARTRASRCSATLQWPLGARRISIAAQSCQRTSGRSALTTASFAAKRAANRAAATSPTAARQYADSSLVKARRMYLSPKRRSASATSVTRRRSMPISSVFTALQKATRVPRQADRCAASARPLLPLGPVYATLGCRGIQPLPHLDLLCGAVELQRRQSGCWRRARHAAVAVYSVATRLSEYQRPS